MLFKACYEFVPDYSISLRAAVLRTANQLMPGYW